MNTEDTKAATPATLTAPDHLSRAVEHERNSRRASNALGSSITAIGALFGRELADHLTRRHEDLAEHASEAIYHLNRHIEQLQARETQRFQEVVGKLTATRFVAHRDAELLSRAMAELERRSRRSGKPVPDFVAEWRADQEAPF